MATEGDTVSRASIESGIDDYNRICLDAGLRDKILSQLNDSSESLALYSNNPSQESLASPATSTRASKTKVNQISVSPPSEGPGPSRLAQVVQSSDIPTPAPTEPPNPLEQKGFLSQNALTPTPTSTTPAGSNAGLTPSTSKEGASISENGEGKKLRPGAMRRLTSKIRKSISSKGS